jgi:hypothetical protein
VCGAVRVPTVVLGFQCMLVGDVARSSGGELVWLGPVSVSGFEDGEGVRGVQRASQK